MTTSGWGRIGDGVGTLRRARAPFTVRMKAPAEGREGRGKAGPPVCVHKTPGPSDTASGLPHRGGQKPKSEPRLVAGVLLTRPCSGQWRTVP